jgi:hypothetical protein
VKTRHDILAGEHVVAGQVNPLKVAAGLERHLGNAASFDTFQHCSLLLGISLVSVEFMGVVWGSIIDK